jgi:predicted nucleic acid-binding protein
VTIPRNVTDERIRYWESSAVLAALLEHDPAATQALAAPGRFVTSALTVAEVRRSIARARHAGRLDDAAELEVTREALRLFESCELHDVDREIMDRVARPFAREPVRTLDAIHLATIEEITTHPQHTTVVTRDDRIRENARAMGCLVE